MKLESPNDAACKLANEIGRNVAEDILGYPAWMVTSAEELETLKKGVSELIPFNGSVTTG